MAKYQVTYKCGHEGIEQITGRVKDRGGKAAWIEANKLCPDCYEAKRQKERAEANAQNADANRDAGLPPLTGSEKQIAWAESIRATQITQLDGLIALMDKSADKVAAQPEAIRQAVEQAYERFISLKTETKASVWIENRNEEYSAHWLLEELSKIKEAKNGNGYV
jgi:hypothetical protein